MGSTTLIHHAASRGGLYPPNSLSGLRACLEAGARLVEIDISPLRDGGWALVHGPNLEEDTTGSGPVAGSTAHEVKSLRLVYRSRPTDEPVGLLPEALELIEHHGLPIELQLDLKPDVFLSDEKLAPLVKLLEPVRDRVRVTSVADWAIRRLHTLDPELPLGFDPMLYLHVDTGNGEPPTVPPFRLGAYGFLDDHPLASRRWGSPAAYLAARAEALLVQAPAGVVWYIYARLMDQVVDQGFDWIAYLHGHGSEVDAWTLDPDSPWKIEMARRLAAAGVDRITTNDPVGLASHLAGDVRL